MIVMVFATTGAMYLNDTSQFLMVENVEGNCKKYWWRNLIFIQNFYPNSEMCMSWSWFVAVDLQLFIISSVVLVISLRHLKLSITISIVLVLVSSVYSGYLGVRDSFSFLLEAQFKTLDTQYTKPFNHISGYLIGQWTGYYLSRKDRKWKLSKKISNIGRAVSVTIFAILIILMQFQRSNFWISFMFPAFGRILWSLPLSFMILESAMCSQNGIIKRTIDSRIILPLSRISFSSYMLNPLLCIFSMLCEASFHFDLVAIIPYTIGWCVLCYMLALVFTVLFERPVNRFIRRFVQGDNAA